MNYGIFNGLGMMAMVAVMCMLIVIVAMAADLVSGWRKAKLRGEARTSYGFSRTLTKFLIYEGIELISVCIDTLVHFAVWRFNVSFDVPLVTIVAAIVLCVVELWSIREKAEDKVRNKMDKALETIISVIGKDKALEMVKELLDKKEVTDDTQRQ